MHNLIQYRATDVADIHMRVRFLWLDETRPDKFSTRLAAISKIRTRPDQLLVMMPKIEFWIYSINIVTYC